MKNLKKDYKVVTKEVAEDELLNLEEKWGAKYPVVIESWQRNREAALTILPIHPSYCKLPPN